MSGDSNGHSNGHAKKLDEIGDDVFFIKESVIPISVAIKDLTHATNNLSTKVEQFGENVSSSMEALADKIQQFMEFQEQLALQHSRAIPLRLVVLMFALIFALIFGVETLRHYMGFFGGVA